MEIMAFLSAMKKELREVNYGDFHVNLAQLSDNYYHNADAAILADRSIAAAEMNDLFCRMEKKADPMAIIERRFLRGLVEFAQTGNPPLKCRSLDASLFMDSWGNVYPSIMWNYKIGNIRDTDYGLEKLWNGELAAEARSMIGSSRDPKHWTSCEAYQSIIGSAVLPIKRHPRPDITDVDGQSNAHVQNELRNT